MARAKMQKKYINQMLELYSDMHIVMMPQQEEEVRGVNKLKMFNSMLLSGNTIPQIPQWKQELATHQTHVSNRKFFYPRITFIGVQITTLSAPNKARSPNNSYKYWMYGIS